MWVNVFYTTTLNFDNKHSALSVDGGIFMTIERSAFLEG